MHVFSGYQVIEQLYESTRSQVCRAIRKSDECHVRGMFLYRNRMGHIVYIRQFRYQRQKEYGDVRAEQRALKTQNVWRELLMTA